MVEVKAMDNNVRTNFIHSYLEKMPELSTYRLPLIYGNHKFYLKNSRLKSELISSAPLDIHLILENITVSLTTNNVCPILGEGITASGCYKCMKLAKLTFKARSACHEGMADIVFDSIMIHTAAVTLSTKFKEYEIDIKTEEKCIADKLCLIHRKVKSCQMFSYCFDDPIVTLQQYNVTSMNVSSVGRTSDNIFGSSDIFSKISSIFPNLPFSFVTIVKYSIIAVIILIIIFVLSGFITIFYRIFKTTKTQ